MRKTGEGDRTGFKWTTTENVRESWNGIVCAHYACPRFWTSSCEKLPRISRKYEPVAEFKR
jgi:hypothetical protein